MPKNKKQRQEAYQPQKHFTLSIVPGFNGGLSPKVLTPTGKPQRINQFLKVRKQTNDLKSRSVPQSPVPNSPVPNSPVPNSPGMKGFSIEEQQGKIALATAIREVRFLKDDLPFFAEVMEEFPLPDHGDEIDLSNPPELIVILQLMKWIADYGSPAVTSATELTQQFKQTTEDFTREQERLITEIQRFEYTVQDLEDENQDLRSKLRNQQKYVKDVKERLEKQKENIEDTTLAQNEANELYEMLESEQLRVEELETTIQNLNNQIHQLRRTNNELHQDWNKVNYENQRLQTEVSIVETKLTNLEQQYDKDVQALDENRHELEYEIQAAQQELKNVTSQTLQTPPSNQGRRMSNVLHISTDFALNEVDVNTLEFHDGLVDENFITLEAEIDEYENSDDNWLSGSEDDLSDYDLDFQMERATFQNKRELEEYQSRRMQFQHNVENESPQFKSAKQSFGVEMKQQEFEADMMYMGEDKEQVELKSSKQSFGENKYVAEFSSGKQQSYGIDRDDEQFQFSGSKQSFGQDKREEKLYSSSSEIYGVDVPKRPEFSSRKQFYGVDAQHQQLSTSKKSFGVDRIHRSFDSSKMSYGVEQPQQPQFQSDSTSYGVIIPPPKFQSRRMSQGVSPQARKLQLDFSTTELAIAGVGKKKIELSMNTNNRVSISGRKPSLSRYQMEVTSFEELMSPTTKKRSQARITAVNIPTNADGDVIDTRSIKFGNILSRFSTLEKKNPGKPKGIGFGSKETIATRNSFLKGQKVPLIDVSSPPQLSTSQLGAMLKTEKVITKVVRRKYYTLRPKVKGYVHVGKTTILAPHVTATKPKIYCCLDGMPASTTVDPNEPDWAKDKKSDPLVPCLLFFQEESNYRQLAREVGAIAVRDIKFQKAFSRHAIGILKLHELVLGVDEKQCLSVLSKRLGHEVQLPPELTEKAPDSSNTGIFIVGEKESHKFYALNPGKRNHFVYTAQKLIKKYEESQNRRKNGIVRKNPVSGFYKMTIPFTPCAAVDDETE